MGGKNKFNESANDIIRKRRVALAVASFLVGMGHAYLHAKGRNIPEIAELALWAGPSVVQGTLEAFVNKAYIGNMLAALTSERGKSYVMSTGIGIAMGASLAAAFNGLGYLLVSVGYDVNRYFSRY